MIRLTVLYPAREGGKFDLDYYAQKHMPLVKARLSGLGLIRTEIEKGISGGNPGAPPPFVCIGHAYFTSLAHFQKAMGTHGREIMADIPNYTDIPPVVQLGEIVG